MTTTTIAVGGADPYDVLIGRGILDQIAGMIGPDAAKVLIVHPPTLGARASALRESLVGDYEVLMAEVPDGEAAKRIEVAAFCWQVMGLSDFTRTDVVIGFGGGAVTDLAGNPNAASGIASAVWDRTPPPAPVLTSTPPNPAPSPTGTFTFTDIQAGVYLFCSVDHGPWTPCASPDVVTVDLHRDGEHFFAVRAVDIAAASEAQPVRLALAGETIACGVAPELPVTAGVATSIATGGPVPRGADAIVMVEYTQPAGSDAIEVRRGASPGQFVSHAGSDIARGEILLRAGTVIGSREIGMLAACGIASVKVARKPRVAVLSTGDELVQPGEPLRPAAIHDANGAIVSAAVNENGGEAAFLGAFPDDETMLEAAMREQEALRRQFDASRPEARLAAE